jgi:hypothetical protein
MRRTLPLLVLVLIACGQSRAQQAFQTCEVTR